MLSKEQQQLVCDNLYIEKAVISKMNLIPNAAVSWEDYYQSGCVALCRAAETYTGQARFFHYAFIVIRNHFYHMQAKQKLDQELEFQDLFQPDVIEEVVGKIQTKRFEALKQGLADIYIEVLDLMQLEFSPKEIAEILHIPVKTVYTRIRTARSKLNVLLENNREEI